jgi:hypothetical protein
MLFYAHVILMTTFFVLLTGGAALLRLFRGRRWRLKVHRTVQTTAAAAGLVAFVLGVRLVAEGGGGHFSSPHSWVGTGAAALVLAAWTLGTLLLKGKTRVTRLRPLHRSVGYGAIVFSLVNIVLGASVAGFWTFFPGAGR